ncbi:MAG: DUF4838 domain-containing protein [Kiritimatiellae bacterium]|nr:DUF4838 domain-containing protein [Kiritimatiellia bacterium]
MPRYLSTVLATAMLSWIGRQGYGDELTLSANGQPAASIVLSSKPTQAAALGAMELRDHIKRISGAELPIVPDFTEVKGPRILVGESAATRALGLRNADFRSQEYLIRRKDDTLILMGRDADKPFGIEVRGRPQWTEGKFGKALAFDGAHDAIVLMQPGFSDAQGSMEIWMLPAAETNGVILRLDGDPWSYHIVSYEDGRLIYTTYDGQPNGGSAIKSGKLAPGWHHVLATWNAKASRKELFVDGQSVGTAGYAPTHCAKARLGIGTMVGADAGGFKGAMDEFRLSGSVRTPVAHDAAPADDAATLAALHFDEGVGPPHLTSSLRNARMSRDLYPDPYDGEGSCYAVYEFLERSCGVRWYGPTEICTVIPSNPTLTVKVSEVRRIPSMAWRCVMPSHNFGGLNNVPACPVLWGNPTVDEMWLYLHRMRNGGEHYGCSHSFYGYYDRFRHRNPRNPAAWEGQHLEWFAHGYEGGLADPQMCYNCEEFIAQVVTDARAAFDGKNPEGVASDVFALGPMDNGNFCKCPVCKKTLINPAETNDTHFTNGKYSDYWFTFCNKVARELRKTHPGKYVSTLTYADWTRHPSFRVEPNIAPQLALAGNTFLDDPTAAVGRHIWGIYREWIRKGKGRPIYLWLYPEFPESSVWSPGYTCFPGFGARLIAKQMKMYVKDGIRGIYPEGITTQLNEYLYNQMAFDATQDTEQIINEFFTLYYGAAAAPMRKLWLEIEETYTNPANWPEEFVKADRDVPITEENSWKRLGTTERMARWAGYMAEAKVAALTETEKTRVRLFEQGEWAPMVKAKQVYDAMSAHQTEVEQLKKALPPTSRIPKLAVPAEGDLSKVDWSRGETVPVTRDIQGYPVKRQAEATLAHDGTFLYLRFRETMDTAKLPRTAGIWGCDDWEVFLAAQRSKPYRQIGIGVSGHFEANAYGESAAWAPGIKAVSAVRTDGWTVSLCLPMADVAPNGLKSGQSLYLNVIRGSTGGEANLALSPNFSSGFHDPARLAEFKVE